MGKVFTLSLIDSTNTKRLKSGRLHSKMLNDTFKFKAKTSVVVFVVVLIN